MTHAIELFRACSSNSYLKRFPALAYFTLILLVFSLPSQGQSLDSSTHPVLWLRADKGGFSDTSWKDFTGNRHDALFYKQGPRQQASLNYNPALLLNGIDDTMRIPYNLTETMYILQYTTLLFNLRTIKEKQRKLTNE